MFKLVFKIMESNKIDIFELTDLQQIPELEVPYLCEIWNW